MNRLISEAKMAKHNHWFQLLKCDFLFILVFYYSKLNKFGFGTVGLTKQNIKDITKGLWELVIGNFHSLLTFYRAND